MAKRPNRLEKRQVILGVDMDGFEPAPQSPVSNFIDVGAGYFTNESDGEVYMQALQAVGPFGPVAAGWGRWDLVYLDDLGVAQIEVGTAQILPAVAYTGAPGNGAPFTAPDVWPVAYVYVDEAAGVLVDAIDITYLRSYSRNDEKGVVGELATDDNTGAGGVLGTNWNRVPIDHQHPPNVDGTDPADVVALGKAPGIANIYARRDHIHEVDAALLSDLQMPRLAGEQSIIFYPQDTQWATKYRLHQFRGRLRGIYPGGAAPPFYADYGLAHAQYPLTVTFGAAAGPGGRDNAVASGTVGLYWFYVYLIAKADGTLALIYSTAGRLPWTQGPLLDNSIYDFPANGWVYWKLIGALRNGQAASWQIVPMRKIGNHVQYEQAQRLIAGSGGAVAVTQFSLAARLPETSMHTNLLLYAEGGNDGGVDMYIRPASVVTGAGETMMLQDTAPLSPMSLLSSGWKDALLTGYAGLAESNKGTNSCWCPTDDYQRIDYYVSVSGAGDREWQVFVQGYEEFTDVSSTEWTF